MELTSFCGDWNLFFWWTSPNWKLMIVWSRLRLRTFCELQKLQQKMQKQWTFFQMCHLFHMLAICDVQKSLCEEHSVKFDCWISICLAPWNLRTCFPFLPSFISISCPRHIKVFTAACSVAPWPDWVLSAQQSSTAHTKIASPCHFPQACITPWWKNCPRFFESDWENGVPKSWIVAPRFFVRAPIQS